MSLRSAGHRLLTVPAVPTGMKTGVCTVPWAVSSAPRRALPSRAVTVKVPGMFMGLFHPVFRADVRKLALRAVRFARRADFAAKEDQHVVHVPPVLLGKQGHEVLFDHRGVVACGQPEPEGDALTWVSTAMPAWTP